MTNLFNNPQEEANKQEEVQNEPQGLKIGDKEYSLDEVEQLVKLGEIGREAETKFNVKIDGIWPKFQQSIQESGDLKKQLETRQQEIEKQTVLDKPVTDQLTPEEIRVKAIAEAEQLGLIHKDNVNKYVSDYIEARDLIRDTDSYIKEQAAEGKPQTSVKDVIDYMESTGIKDSKAAYKLMFENELEQWKAQQVQETAKRPMITTEGSSAGSKQPQEVHNTRDTINQALSDFLKSRQAGV